MVWGGHLLAATDHGVVLVDPSTGAVEKQDLAGRMVTCAAASPDGTVLTCGTSQGEVWMRNQVSQTTSRVLCHMSYEENPGDYPRAPLCECRRGDEREKSRRCSHPGHAMALQSATFFPCGTRFVTSGEDGLVKVFDSSTLALEGSLEHAEASAPEGDVFGTHVSPDASRIASCGCDGLVKIWDATTFALVHSLESPSEGGVEVFCVRFSPDGMQVAAGREGGCIQFWDARSGVEDFVLRVQAQFAMFEGLEPLGQAEREDAPGPDVNAIEFSPDGTLLACACDDASVRVYDVATQALRRVFPGHGGHGACICMPNDAHPECGVNGHRREVLSLAFSADGLELASGGQGRTVKIWEVETGTLLRTFDVASAVWTLSVAMDWRMPRRIAVAQGLHPRLGAGSRVQQLDSELLGRIAAEAERL